MRTLRSRGLMVFLVVAGLASAGVEAATLPTTLMGRIWDKTHNTPCADACVNVDSIPNTTDSNGLYLFENEVLSSGEHYFQVTKTGMAMYRDSILNLAEGASNTKNADMYVGAQITGIVSEFGTGTPLVGARVQGEIVPAETCWEEVLTTAGGAYQLRQPPGEIHSQAFEDNHAPSLEYVLDVVDEGVYPDRNIELRVGGSISGTVFYMDTTITVAGVQVLANYEGDLSSSMPTHVTYTAGDGSYMLQHLYPNPMRIEVAAPPGFANGYRFGVPVNDLQNTPTIDIGLPLGGDLQGTVEDFNGAPVAGAGVLVFPASGNSVQRKDKTTNAAGVYSMTGLQVGVYSLSVTPPQGCNLQMQQISNVSITAGATVTKNFTLQTGGSVTGKVKGVDQQIISQARIRVYLDLQYPFEDLFEEILTNGAGIYNVDGLSPFQAYTLAVESPASNTIYAFVASKGVTVPEATLPSEKNFVLPFGGGAQGVVQNAEGDPVTLGTIAALSYNVGIGNGFNDSLGQYLLKGLPENNYLMIAIPTMEGSNEQRSQWYTHVTPGVIATHNVTLPEGGILQGVVFDPAGNSLPGAQITVLDPMDVLACMPRFWKQAYSDSGGNYAIKGLPSGTYTVQAMPEAWDDNRLAPQNATVNIIPGGTTNQNIYLTDNGTKVFGTVRDQYGNRIIGAIAAFWNPETGFRMLTQTDRWGNYAMMMPSGDYRAQAYFISLLGSNLAMQPENSVPVPAAIPPNPANFYHEFVMEEGGSISGVVHNQLGEPVNLSLVQLVENGNPLPVRTALTDPNGYYRIMGLHSAEYTLSVVAEGFSTSTQTVRTTLGSQTAGIHSVIIQLTSIAGLVMDKAGHPLPGARLEALGSSQAPAAAQAQTGKDGGYILQPLSGGPFQVRASATGMKSQIQNSLYPGARADFKLEPLIGHDEAISYPNPCRGDAITFLYWLERDAVARIRVYNLAGELVWDWEGRGSGGLYQKHVWNVSGVAPGVYLFKITAREQDGTVRSFPTGKLTVIQ